MIVQGGKAQGNYGRKGTLYHLIVTYFLQQLCPYVSQLETNPMAAELGTAGFLNEAIYNKLASIYNNSTHESLKSFAVNCVIYVTSGIQKESPATFDELPALAMLQGINFVNKHYCQARRWQVQSDNHKPFDKYCGNWSYLLLYRSSLLECGDQVLLSLALPKLPDSVKISSLDNKKISPAKPGVVPITAGKRDIVVLFWKTFWR
jgi:hypothetical protein